MAQTTCVDCISSSAEEKKSCFRYFEEISEGASCPNQHCLHPKDSHHRNPAIIGRWFLFFVLLLMFLMFVLFHVCFSPFIVIRFAVLFLSVLSSSIRFLSFSYLCLDCFACSEHARRNFLVLCIFFLAVSNSSSSSSSSSSGLLAFELDSSPACCSTPLLIYSFLVWFFSLFVWGFNSHSSCMFLVFTCEEIILSLCILCISLPLSFLSMVVCVIFVSLPFPAYCHFVPPL